MNATDERKWIARQRVNALRETERRNGRIIPVSGNEIGLYVTGIARRIADAELRTKGFYTCLIAGEPYMFVTENTEQ